MSNLIFLLYVGISEDIVVRFLSHTFGKGAKWTKTHPVVAQVFESPGNLVDEAIYTRNCMLIFGGEHVRGGNWVRLRLQTSIKEILLQEILVCPHFTCQRCYNKGHSVSECKADIKNKICTNCGYFIILFTL